MDLESEVSDNSIIYFGKFGHLGLVSNNVCHCQIADTPCWLISLIVCSKRMLQSMGLLRLITITCPCQIIVIQEYLPVGGYPGLIFANIYLSSDSGYPGLIPQQGVHCHTVLDNWEWEWFKKQSWCKWWIAPGKLDGPREGVSKVGYWDAPRLRNAN